MLQNKEFAAHSKLNFKPVAMSKVINANDFLLVQRNNARPRLEELHADLFPDGGPHPKSLIEIHGTPNSGKSLLLWQIMAYCLPEISNGGKYCNILFLNLSQKFDTRKFMAYIEQVIRTANTDITETELSMAVQKCLDSVTMFNCFDPSDLALALYQSQHILNENQNISLMVVDSLCDFYILEAQGRHLKMSSYYMNLVANLRQICTQSNICIAYTVEQSFINATGLTLLPTVEYRLQMRLMDDGRRCINNDAIYIDSKGIHYESPEGAQQLAKKMKYV